MKRILSIFFVLTYLLSFTELRELSKLPEFIEHFKEHKLNDSSTSLFGFIVLHYMSGNQKDSDYAKDMKLPFKAHDFSSFSFTIQDLPKKLEFKIFQIKEFKETHSNFHYEFYFQSSYLDSIFQPPELV